MLVKNQFFLPFSLLSFFLWSVFIILEKPDLAWHLIQYRQTLTRRCEMGAGVFSSPALVWRRYLWWWENWLVLRTFSQHHEGHGSVFENRTVSESVDRDRNLD